MRPISSTMIDRTGGLKTLTPAERRAGISASAFGLSVLGFATLAALGAQVRIPIPWSDVPMTMQSFAVVLAGLTLSPAAAVASMVLYLAFGAAGLPVFTQGSAGMFGATGGYLFGFVFAALTISLVRGRSGSMVRLILAGGAGLGVLFACGLAWRYVYAMIFGLDAGWYLAAGVVPFLPKAIVELLLAVSVTNVWNQYRSAER
jgi:biotin transport system substrate-specific component